MRANILALLLALCASGAEAEPKYNP